MNPNKKNVDLCGKAILPVDEGACALLACGGHYIRTSRVVKIHEYTPQILRFETVKIVAEVECADVMNLSGFVVFGFFAARRWRVDDSAGTLNNGVRSLAHQVLDSDVEAGGVDGDMVS